jgi:hypothetical protein
VLLAALIIAGTSKRSGSDLIPSGISQDKQTPTRGSAMRRSGSPLVGKNPIGAVAAECYFAAMGLILLILVLLILFGGGGFYIGGPVIGGGGIGLILLICLIIYLVGGFGSKT